MARLSTAQPVRLMDGGGAFSTNNRPSLQASGKARPRTQRRSAGSAPDARNARSTRNLAIERKYVSILRADLHRSSDLVTGLDLEESIARLAPALEQMRTAVHQYGGIVHREMGDGIFAVFGAPVASDLHAVMACVAALDLVRRIEGLKDIGIRVRIGVHSGLVVAGPRQLDYTSMYDFDGPPLIMAERLQAAAQPGQALASESCRSLAEGYIQFGAAQAHTLKGFAEPIMVYPIRAASESSKWQLTMGRSTTHFVGRNAELSELLTLAKSVSEGTGRTALVSGEPGVGKSRLVHEAQSLLQQQGWQTLEVECNPIVGDAPFSLLKHILVAATSELPDAEQTTLRSELSAAQYDALHLILDGASAEISSAWDKLPPRARAHAIIDMSCAVVMKCVGHQPTLLLIEDVQWTDKASAPAVQAIAALSQRLPFFVLATVRSGEAWERLENSFDRTIVVVPLERVAGIAMLDQLLGPSSRLADLKVRILEHTGAMPLFLEEVCRGLVEAGRLKGERGNFEPASSELELGVPLTVQGMIASRIDRLSPREKRVLQVASAIGPQVPSRLLQAICALEQSVYRKSLNALLTAGMLTCTPQLRSEASFPHEFVRQVAYEATLESDRVKLHNEILAQLGKQAATAPHDPELAASMVHHATKAKQWREAAEIAAAIARRCFSQAAFADAKRYFELAMSSIDKLPPSPTHEAKAIDLRIEARMAYGNLGEIGRWLDLAREAEARALSSGDQMRRVPALAMRAAALNFCGTPHESLEAGEAAVREATKSGQLGWLAYAEYGLGQARFVAGRYAEAIDVLERAYRRFRFEGASPPPGGGPAQAALLCSMMICVTQVALGNDQAAADAQARAEAIAAECGGPAAAIAAGFSGGVLLLAMNRAEEAEVSLAQSLKLASQHEVHLFIPVLANQHGGALIRLFRMEEARVAYRTASNEAEVLGHRSAALRSELGLALCEATEPTKRISALDVLSRCEQIARQGGYQPLELEALLIKGRLLSLLGQDCAAVRSASEELLLRTGAVGTKREVGRALDLVLS
ncbi:AAA family ATPase [Bradyrhizobium diazoefficiens]|uniref:ATP-binding protein n=1 Tax=Bradyrhizobium diazoefficiens TaxID=1355477 RepID=UPI00190DC098|nr:adenylate/guanylate cyclase domain-containing protein [Bradyrhizobium diazoefficiens]QQO14774.1 AAA family ATPase [Bradyrhizobium diazoefficiens]